MQISGAGVSNAKGWALVERLTRNHPTEMQRLGHIHPQDVRDGLREDWQFIHDLANRRGQLPTANEIHDLVQSLDNEALSSSLDVIKQKLGLYAWQQGEVPVLQLGPQPTKEVKVILAEITMAAIECTGDIALLVENLTKVTTLMRLPSPNNAEAGYLAGTIVAIIIYLKCFGPGDTDGSSDVLNASFPFNVHALAAEQRNASSETILRDLVAAGNAAQLQLERADNQDPQGRRNLLVGIIHLISLRWALSSRANSRRATGEEVVNTVLSLDRPLELEPIEPEIAPQTDAVANQQVKAATQTDNRMKESDSERSYPSSSPGNSDSEHSLVSSDVSSQEVCEICGTNYAFMLIVVEVVSKKDYLEWLSDQSRLRFVFSAQSIISLVAPERIPEKLLNLLLALKAVNLLKFIREEV
ncbi:hypothetical protein L7F22_011910 [Adiantum nelumboides]|nr:hypothetical protein [Adiantum nelumboides]